MHSEGTQCASTGWSTCPINNWICRGEAVHRSSVELDTVRGNCYLLTAEDSFIRYCRAYPIPNKEARTVARVLVDQHFNIYGLPDQLQPSSRYKTPQHHPIILLQILSKVSTEPSWQCSELGEMESKIIGIYGLMCQCSRTIPL